MSKVFLITGASKGFGRNWAETALADGHKVIASARTVTDLDALVEQYGDAILPVKLDVNDRKQCFEAVALGRATFGRIDVLISNAGYGHFGMVEETTEQEARNQIETNIFGSLWIIQAALPVMREQRSGHIMQVSSMGGVIALPNLGVYHATKWAVEGLCESLAQEVADFGIHMTLLEPGPYTTDWAKVSSVRSEQISDYDGVREKYQAKIQTFLRGNPEATGQAIMKLASMENPPLRLILGKHSWLEIEPSYERRLNEWKEHLPLAESAHSLDD